MILYDSIGRWNEQCHKRYELYIYIYINLNTFNNYSVHAYQFKERKPHIQFVKIRRYLQTYDVTFRSAVKSVSRLFFSLNDLTDDKETNDVISGSAVRSASCLFFGVNGLTDDKTNIFCFDVLFTAWDTEDPDLKCFIVLDIVSVVSVV